MSSKLTLSVLGLYNYDNTIFDEMTVPEGVDASVLIDNILTECAELEILYPDSSFLKTALKTWSLKELAVWDKLYDLWSSQDLGTEYNYRRVRTPNITHAKTGTETETPSGQIIDTGTNNNTTTDSVSAYNSSTFENREQSVSTGGSGNTRSFNQYQNEKSFDTETTETGTETIAETGHKKPISEIIKDATEVAVYNIYDYITESFKERFCLLVY